MERIRFERRQVLNTNKSIVAGYNIYDDVDFAIIRAGSSHEDNDCVEHNLIERTDVAERPDVATAYTAWKKYQDTNVVDGFDLRLFPHLTPAQIENLRAVNIFSVEDIINASTKTLDAIVNDANYIQLQAINFLDARNNASKVAADLTLATSENKKLKDEYAALEAELQELRKASKNKKDKDAA